MNFESYLEIAISKSDNISRKILESLSDNDILALHIVLTSSRNRFSKSKKKEFISLLVKSMSSYSIELISTFDKFL